MSSTATVAARTNRLRFGFHGFALEVEASWPDLLEVMAQRFRDLRDPAEDEPALGFRYLLTDRPRTALPRPVGSARPIYETPHGQAVYFPETDEVCLDYRDDARLLVRPASNEALIALRPGADTLWLASHPLFTLASVELLKRRALYSIHAAGLAKKGRSVILAGATGSGKSTLTLALLERGFDLIGDDMTFLRSGPVGVRALAFPDEIDITLKTLGMFPDLAKQLSDTVRPGWKKLQVQACSLGNGTVAWESEPAAIVFPTISRSYSSTLESITAGEALIELAPNVLLTEPNASQRHLGVLGVLVNHCRCYRLLAGPDIRVAAKLIESLLGGPAKA